MIHGIINVHKEKGFTSHDVVAKLRGITHQRKVGHTGTLDPDATGVLPVCLGKGTKLCDMLTDKNKTYQTVLLLGQSTDTQDISGTVEQVGQMEQISIKAVNECIESFIGAYQQIPPMYSALKVGGKKLYELAREGITIERKARTVTIYAIQILSIELPRVTMEVTCSKGTYIRTLCHDIGEKLGCYGCMESLIRTKVERFALEDSHTLDEIQMIVSNGHLSDILIPIDAMFEQYRQVNVGEAGEKLAYNGNDFYREHLVIPQMDVADEEYVRVYTNSSVFIGIYQYQKEQEKFHIRKMFLEAEDKK